MSRIFLSNKKKQNNDISVYVWIYDKVCAWFRSWLRLKSRQVPGRLIFDILAVPSKVPSNVPGKMPGKVPCKVPVKVPGKYIAFKPWKYTQNEFTGHTGHFTGHLPGTLPGTLPGIYRARYRARYGARTND